jgi:hypothetical protein
MSSGFAFSTPPRSSSYSSKKTKLRANSSSIKIKPTVQVELHLKDVKEGPGFLGRGETRGFGG